MDLKNDIQKIPNLLSLSRIVLSPLVFVFLSIPGPGGKILCIGFLSLLFLTDLFDGILARKLNQTSDLGRILDPLADKVLVAILFVALVFFRGFPVGLIVFALVRDGLILLGGLYIRHKQNRIIESNIWGKLSTAVLMFAVLFLILEDFWYITVGLFAIGFLFMIISSITYLGVFYGFLEPGGKKIMRWTIFLCILAILIAVFTSQFVPAKYDADEFFRENYSELDSPDAQDLARQYAPIIWFSNGEKYRPVDVAIYLDHSKIMAQKKYMGLVETVVAVEPVTAEKIDSFNGPEFFLALDHAELDNPEFDRTGHRKTVYARVLKTLHGYILQYWFFYLGSEAGDSGIYVHDADWEMIQILLDEDRIPVAAGYSAHYYGTVRKWQDVENDSGHPVVYVARGSHACYFVPGIHKTYLDNVKLLHFGTDTTGKGERLEPGTGYQLSLVTEKEWWTRFCGYWTAPGGGGVEGPVYRNPRDTSRSMWQSPVAWMRFYDTDHAVFGQK